MRTDALDYDLPDGRIAQVPADRRDESRMLVLERGRIRHLRFRDLPDPLRPGDLLVLNEARVLPARLRARRETGGHTELLLVRPRSRKEQPGADDRPVWKALARPAGRLNVGERLHLEHRPADEVGGASGSDEVAATAATAAAPEGPGAPRIEVEILEKGRDGAVTLALPAGTDVEALLERRGEMPLPPYIERRDDDPRAEIDRRRYQTVYARRPGAVAAPTAGLHFTEELLGELEAGGVESARLSLAVGPGTFRPVTAEEVEEHEMEPERYRIPGATAAALEATRERGGRVVAVGTTVVRALEHSGGAAGEGEADLFIVPGYRFRVVDALLTNFHLPRSTPLFLVAAFAGAEALRRAYREAIDEDYRFYSYGDAMLVL